MNSTLKMPPAKSEKRGAERRRSEREPHIAQAWLCSPTSNDPDDRLDAMTLNLSKHGVRFELACPLPIGSFYTIEIGVGPQQIRSEVRIISSVQNEISLYEIGAEFC